MADFAALRSEMVDRQIAARGVRSLAVLDAMRSVPREEFVPPGLREFAYDDSPLPIASEQTISQPYIVAYMVEALALEGDETVLEIGAGSGYAAAVLGAIARQVYTIERIPELAAYAREALARAGCRNVEVIEGDGTKGLPEHAPYDAIVVAAGGPEVPESLKQQLGVGGRLVIPIGSSRNVQELVRVTRKAADEFVMEDLADVRFVPLIGAEGWNGPPPAGTRVRDTRDDRLRRHVDDASDPFLDIESANIDPLIERVGEARIVLIGEASHGTSEFYRLRGRISARLVGEKGFRLLAIEGDWPDAARIDHYVRHLAYPPSEWTAFARFPTWMWRNDETREFVDWLRIHNSNIAEDRRVAFHGLDLYSMYSSIQEILRYLDDVDPATASVARLRYGCLTPWQSDPATYGHAALTGSYRSCENDVVNMLKELAGRHWHYARHDGERFLDAVQNARLIANAERYYRTMYYGSRESWNLRDNYMFETLQTLIEHYAPNNKAIVWAHNSHVGDAAATEMSSRGELNIGHLCRRAYGDSVYIVGFGTDSGTVAAASEWDGAMQVMNVRPSNAGSYEGFFHETGQPGFTLGLRDAGRDLRMGLSKPRLERAIGVIYRPETELASHYFQAVLPQQFDEYVWIDRTRAVTPIATHELAGMPDTYPFGL